MRADLKEGLFKILYLNGYEHYERTTVDGEESHFFVKESEFLNFVINESADEGVIKAIRELKEG